MKINKSMEHLQGREELNLLTIVFYDMPEKYVDDN